MDRYGYLVNPGEDYQMGGNPTRTKQWLVLGGILVLGLGIWWLVQRNRAAQPIGRQLGGGTPKRLLPQYPVTAPPSEMIYHGAGMPFGIDIYEPAVDTYISVDNNGIARVFSADGRAGGIVQTTGGKRYFVTEDVWNEGLCLTREANVDVLETVMPYDMLGPGYIGYVTDGMHIGASVYITLQGQIGRALFKAEGGQLMYVPLEVIDQTPEIWSVYVKPGAGG